MNQSPFDKPLLAINKDRPLVLFVLVIFAGIIAGGVFSWGIPGLVLPLCLMPLFLAWQKTESEGFRTITAYTTSFFLPFFLVVLSWFLRVNVSGLIGMNRLYSVSSAIIGWLLMSFVVCIPMLPLGLFFGFTIKLRPTPVAWILFCASWVVLEWLRSVWFSVVLYGSQGTIGDYWNFGNFGLGSVQTPLAVLSRFIGMYGLTFLVVLMALILFFALQQKNLTAPLTLTVMMVIAFGVSIRYYRTDNSGNILQASVLQNATTIPEAGYHTSIDNKSDEKRDLIVLPEYSGMFLSDYSSVTETLVNKRLKESGFSVTVSKGNRQRWYGTLDFHDAKGRLISEQTKGFLIPTGEYLPYMVQIFYHLTGQSSIITHFQHYRQVYKGNPAQTFSYGGLTIGPVACSGILGTNIYRNLTRHGAKVLTNSASLIDFAGSKSYFRQSILLARFHAIANNRPFIQSSLGAPAFALNSDGNYIVKPTDSKTRFIDFSFMPNSQITPFTRLGEWVLTFSLLLLIMYGLMAACKLLRRR